LQDGASSFDRLSQKAKSQRRLHREGKRHRESGRASQPKPAEKDNCTKQFLEAVKNHTVYRRDNFVNKLANKTKQVLEPYLRF